MERHEGDVDWDAVALDEAFVASATVREQPASVRVAKARRISAEHQRAEAWRAGPATTSRTAHRNGRLRPVLTALAVVLLGSAFVLAPRFPLTEQVTAGVMGDGTPVVPRSSDAQGMRLLPPATAPAGEGGYRLLFGSDDRPVGFDPCVPVHWVMRSAGAPPDGQATLAEAFATLSRATGLVFVFDGLTDEAYDRDRPLVQPDRYGERYAPVLVVWSDPFETRDLSGDVAGFATNGPVDPDGHGPRLVSGSVVLDTPQLAASKPGRPAVLGLVLHELGHLVGLDHVADEADSMYESSGPARSYTPGALRGLAVVGRAPCMPAGTQGTA